MTAKKTQPRIPRKVFSDPGNDRNRIEVGKTRNAQNTKERVFEGARTVAPPPTIPHRMMLV
jgi:hypothetical protein